MICKPFPGEKKKRSCATSDLIVFFHRDGGTGGLGAGESEGRGRTGSTRAVLEVQISNATSFFLSFIFYCLIEVLLFHLGFGLNFSVETL